MKKKVFVFLAAFLMILGFASANATTANAASWGAKKFLLRLKTLVVPGIIKKMAK